MPPQGGELNREFPGAKQGRPGVVGLQCLLQERVGIGEPSGGQQRIDLGDRQPFPFMRLGHGEEGVSGVHVPEAPEEFEASAVAVFGQCFKGLL